MSWCQTRVSAVKTGDFWLDYMRDVLKTYTASGSETSHLSYLGSRLKTSGKLRLRPLYLREWILRYYLIRKSVPQTLLGRGDE